MRDAVALRKEAKRVIDGLSEEKLQVAIDLLLSVQGRATVAVPKKKVATSRELTAQLKEAENIVKNAVREKRLNSTVSWDAVRGGV